MVSTLKCLNMYGWTDPKFIWPIKSLALFSKVTALSGIAGPLPEEQQLSDANRQMAPWEM